MVCGIVSAVILAVFVSFSLQPHYYPPTPTEDFAVVKASPQLESHIGLYKKEMGDDYEGYKNHCLRVLSYAKYFLKQDGMSAQEIKEKTPIIVAALAYHDLALWADGELAYLEPSAKRAEVGLKNASSFVASNMKIVREIIMQHHKFLPWHGDGAALVNAVRKADWVDATMGAVRHGMPAGNIAKANEVLPNAGFHNTLAGMGARLSPDSYVKRLDVFKIFKL